MSPPRPTTSTLPRKTPIYQKQPKKNQKDSDPSHRRRTEGSSATSCPALGPPLPGPFQQPPPPREPGLPCPARPPRVPSVPPRPPASPRLLPGPSLLPQPLRAAPSPWPRRSGSGPAAPRSRPAPGEAAAGGHRGGPGEIPEDPGGARIPLRAPLPACGHPCGLPSLPGAAGLASFPVSSLSPSPLPLRRGTREGRGASPGAFQSRGVPLASVRVLGAACSVPGEPASRLGAAFRSLRSGHLAY